jgi:hypothetical protein
MGLGVAVVIPSEAIEPPEAADEAPTPPEPHGSQGAPNKRVMVYLPPGLLRTIKLHAVDRDCSVSDAFADAAREYLASRGVAVPEIAPVNLRPTTPVSEPTGGTIGDLVEAIERQGHLIEEVLRRIEDPVGGPRPPGPAPAGTKAAHAMRTVLGHLKAAGTAGLSGRELETSMRGTGVTSGAAENAKAVLHGAGLVRCEGRRWYVNRVEPS